MSAINRPASWEAVSTNTGLAGAVLTANAQRVIAATMKPPARLNIAATGPSPPEWLPADRQDAAFRELRDHRVEAAHSISGWDALPYCGVRLN